jgi:hypothetical protein
MQAINAKTPGKMKAGADRGATKTLPMKSKFCTHIDGNRKMSWQSRIVGQKIFLIYSNSKIDIYYGRQMSL